MKERLAVPRFNKSRREFLKNIGQGIAGAFGMGLLARNEKVNQVQNEQIKELDEWDELAGAFAIETYSQSLANDEAILTAINVVCQELGLPEFFIQDGQLYRAKKK